MAKVSEQHFRWLDFLCFFFLFFFLPCHRKKEKKTKVDFSVPQFPHLTIKVSNFAELNFFFFARYVKTSLGCFLFHIICTWGWAWACSEPSWKSSLWQFCLILNVTGLSFHLRWLKRSWRAAQQTEKLQGKKSVVRAKVKMPNLELQ